MKNRKRIIQRKTLFGELIKLEWKHRNLITLIISIFIAYYILQVKPITIFLGNLIQFGYFAGFVIGMFFTYAFTTAPASAMLFNLGKILNPFFLAFIGAFGAMISDYLIFRFVRNRLLREFKLLSKEIGTATEPFSKLIATKSARTRIWKGVSRSKIWRTIIPVIAGLIIASPLPDEIGVAMLGASRFEPKRFLLLAYSLNFLGILAIALLSGIG